MSLIRPKLLPRSPTEMGPPRRISNSVAGHPASLSPRCALLVVAVAVVGLRGRLGCVADGVLDGPKPGWVFRP
jgi:hypothetical protein